MPQFWSTLVSFAGLELSVHQAFRHPTCVHPNHVSNPTKLGLDDDGLYTGGFSFVKNLQIGDAILLFDSQDGAESWHVEELKFLYMPAVQCPCLITIEQGGKDHSIVDLQLHR